MRILIANYCFLKEKVDTGREFLVAVAVEKKVAVEVNRGKSPERVKYISTGQRPVKTEKREKAQPQPQPFIQNG